MKKFAVRFTEEAEADLLRLFDFLLERDVGAAERAQRAIAKAVEALLLKQDAKPILTRSRADDEVGLAARAKIASRFSAVVGQYSRCTCRNFCQRRVPACTSSPGVGKRATNSQAAGTVQSSNASSAAG
mgnify:CR=1 FL=1